MTPHAVTDRGADRRSRRATKTTRHHADRDEAHRPTAAPKPGGGPDVSLDELEALLLVQEHDIARDQLRHRRERDAGAGRAGRARRASCASARRERAEVGERHRVVLAEERRLDDEARAVGERADEVNKRLYSGTDLVAA